MNAELTPKEIRDDRPLNLWTLPNAISVVRLLLIPLFLWLVFAQEEERGHRHAIDD